MSQVTNLGLICIRLVDENLDALNCVSNPLHNEEVVHNLRVMTKRLRAAWKVVSDSESASRRKSALKELSALLAGKRDIDVLINLAQQMADIHPDAPFSTVVKSLEEQMTEPVADQSGEAIRSILVDEKAAWSEVRFEGLEQTALRRAIRTSQNKARQAARVAMVSTDPEEWHSWRKCVKTLRYQREFLAEIQNRSPGKWDARISRLGSALGARNDLANLTTIVESLGNHPGLRKAIAMEERKVLGNCRRLGRRNLLP